MQKPQEKPELINGSTTRKSLPRLKELGALFLRLGFTAFGGPTAHIALFQDEVVRRRKWIDNARFLDLLGATNLIPGPNSTEMAIHIGYLRAGFPGMILAGVCFIAPAVLIVMGLSWLYVTYGAVPQLDSMLYGIQPVMIAIILHAFWGFSKTALKGIYHTAVFLLIFGLYFLQTHPLLLLSLGALLFLAREIWVQKSKALPGLILLPFFPLQFSMSSVPYNPWTLFFTFLKIGSVLYGSGYVLLAFLESDFVAGLGWLTEQQLLDAIAIGQLTPGPVFTTATFIGFLLGGVPGAILATIGIFLPSFVFVAISNPFIPRLRSSVWASTLIDGVVIASLGMMAGVTIILGKAALIDTFTFLIAITAFFALVRFKVNSSWLILVGALSGLIKFFLT